MNRSRFSIAAFVLVTLGLGTLALATQPSPGDSPGNGLKRGFRVCFDKGDPPPPCPPCMDYKPPQCICMKIPGCKLPSLAPR